MSNSTDHLKMVSVFEAENEAMRYCKTCKTVKLSMSFMGAMCGDCLLGVAVETANDDHEIESRCVTQAIVTLIKNHRAEFDHLLTDEKKKAALLTEAADNSTWADWHHANNRKK